MPVSLAHTPSLPTLCMCMWQLEEWWEQFAYLRPRYPIAININVRE
jgi:hypothetical protein